ncbi:MAG: trypsin-like peptidase domain-containing protein [Gemmatimonadales bacterium]
MSRALRRVAFLGVVLSIGCGDPSNGLQIAPDSIAAQAAPVSPSPPDLGTSRRTAIVDAVARVGPSVVSISVTSHQRVSSRSLFDNWFLPRRTERLVQGYGTGFIIRADGLIITNHHVIDNAEEIVVTLTHGIEFQAELVGGDPVSDIALLRIDGTDLPVSSIGRSADLLIGEWVVALGNPYGYMLGDAEPTVTAGVVSATRRNILPTGSRPGLYLDMIQTDAAINPGNSGGPLVNALGEVIGVNSSIFTSSGGSIGIGFAIPIERAMRVADELLRQGTVRRAWTGLEVAGADAMRDWKRQGGVLVVNVAPQGPAARIGIGRESILTEAAGRVLRTYLDWEAVKLGLHVGDSVSVTFHDNTRSQTRILVAEDLPTATAERVQVLEALDLVTVTPSIQSERGLQSTSGALILSLSDNASQMTGLRAGDVILRIGRIETRTAQQVSEILQSLRRGQRFRFVLERDGSFLYTDLVFQ